jgi:hypothetical protein
MEQHIYLFGEFIPITWHGGEAYVPIRPICERLSLDVSRQYGKVRNQELFKGSKIMPAIGSDGRLHNMLCVPEQYIAIWLLTIQCYPGPHRKILTEFQRSLAPSLSFFKDGKIRYSKPTAFKRQASAYLLVVWKAVKNTFTGKA